MRVASLPMYDAAPGAVAAWWDAIARALRAEGVDAVPSRLMAPAELVAHWRDPRLLLSQTCGYPLVTTLRAAVQVVGAWRYTAPGCAGIHYRSELVARIGDAEDLEGFRGRVAAINAPDSYSGCHALRALVAPRVRDGSFFGRRLVSGSHRASLAALRAGEADIAAVDGVSLAGFGRHAPALLRGLRVVGATAPAPGLPLVTSARTSHAELGALRRALQAACDDPAAAQARAALFIGGFEALSADAWRAIDDVRRIGGDRTLFSPADEALARAA